jgi:hypothetical protein
MLNKCNDCKESPKQSKQTHILFSVLTTIITITINITITTTGMQGNAHEIA